MISPIVEMTRLSPPVILSEIVRMTSFAQSNGVPRIEPEISRRTYQVTASCSVDSTVGARSSMSESFAEYSSFSPSSMHV